MKRTLLATVVVFVAWGVLDFLLHGLALRSSYIATAPLWRPMDQIPLWLIYLVTLIVAGCFVTIYDRLLAEHTAAAALRYGLLFGIASGASAGFGMYAVMPIPLSMAVIWFLGILVEAVLGGWLAWAVLHRGRR